MEKMSIPLPLIVPDTKPYPPTGKVVQVPGRYVIQDCSYEPLVPPVLEEGGSWQHRGPNRLVDAPTSAYHSRQIAPLYSDLMRLDNYHRFKYYNGTLVAFPRMIMDWLWEHSRRTWYYYNDIGRHNEDGRRIMFVAASRLRKTARLPLNEPVRVTNGFGYTIEMVAETIPELDDENVAYYYGVASI